MSSENNKSEIELSAEDKKVLGNALIVFIVFVVLLLYLVSAGLISFLRSPTKKYDDIDFGRIPEDIEKEIKKLETELRNIRARRKKYIKVVNMTMIIIRILIVFLFVCFHLCVYWLNKPYTISEFLSYNETILLLILLSLFLLSDKYNSLQNGYIGLRKFVEWVVEKFGKADPDLEQSIIRHIYFLETLYYVHPGIFRVKLST